MNDSKRIITIVCGLGLTISLTALQPSSSSSSSSSSPSSSTNTAAIPSARFLRAALFLENGTAENAYCGNQAILLDLAVALKEQSCPLIVNGPTLHALLFKIKNTPPKHIALLEEMTDLEKKQSDLEKKAVKDANDLALQVTYLQRLRAIQEKIIIHKFEYIPEKIRAGLSKILYHWERWDIYRISDSTLYLMIPHHFFTHVKNNWKGYPHTYPNVPAPQASRENDIKKLATQLGVSEEEIMIGFKIHHPDIMQKVTLHTLRTELEKSYEGMLAKALAVTRYSHIIPSRWNQPIDVNAIKKIFVSSEKTASPLLGVWNVYIVGHGEYSNKKYVQSFPLQNDPNAAIAGLNIENFNSLLAFFCTRITTASVYYLTCFGGGHHQKIVERELNLLAQKKYGTIVITSGALGDISVIENAQSFTKYFNEMEKILENFLVFTTSSERFNNHYPAFLKRKMKNIELATRLLNDYDTLENTRSIFVKGWKSGKLLDSEGTIFTVDAAQSSLTTPLTLSNKGIVLTSSHIATPLVINTAEPCDSHTYPVFVSQPSGNTLHIFDEIEITHPCTLDAFIKQSLLSLDYAYPKKFIIKKVKGLIPPKSTVPVEIENLEVSTDGPMKFTSNGTTFSGVNTAKACETCVEESDDTPFEWVETMAQPK